VHGHDRASAQSAPVDVPREKKRFLPGLMSLAGAVGIVLLVPFVILLVGLPIAVVVRGVAEAIAWLLPRLAG